MHNFRFVIRALRAAFCRWCARPWRVLLPLLCIGGSAASEFPLVPYVNPAQLDCAWPLISHYKLPWRGYTETRTGSDFLRGLGINLQVPDDHDELAIRLLAETGFRTFRMEVGWGEATWDETRLEDERKYRRRFELCAKYAIRPTILINAHHARPCPAQVFRRRLLTDGRCGTTRLQLDEVADLVIGRSGLSDLSEPWAAEALITAIEPQTGVVTISKPLPHSLTGGEVSITTLKYAPLHPVGTPEFEETSTAWAAHVTRVCRLAHESGVTEFDVEIWNELNFGSRYLDINQYFDPELPKVGNQPDPLHPGGRCWELARRIATAVKAEFPKARCIWGFSNTGVFECPIEKLPPGMDGQSYHPYGTALRTIDPHTLRGDQRSLEGFIPQYRLCIPEGVAATFIQPECLLRHLNPIDRITRRPSGTTRFHHYVSEHGILPSACGVDDEDEAWRLKATGVTRSFLFWLNKGADALHYFTAFEETPVDFGLLPVNLRSLAPDAKFADTATPPMRALKNLVGAFAGSMPLDQAAPLQIEVTAIGEQTVAFSGNDLHPPLAHRELFTALPFQIDEGRHVIAFYVMTRDVTKRFRPQLFRLRITGTNGRTVSCYDPHEDRTLNVITQTVDDALEVTVFAGAHPRVLTISR